MAAKNRLEFLFLNLGHMYDHLFILIYATVAALVLPTAFDMTYAELIVYATPGFIAFGLPRGGELALRAPRGDWRRPSAPSRCPRDGSRTAGAGGA